MADFYHLGYFPFCIKAPLQPLDRAAEMPLADAMRIFWLAKRARVVIKFSFNAHLSQGGGTSPENFVRAVCDIDEEKAVFSSKSLRERVCLKNDTLIISGSTENAEGSGSTQYVMRFFTDSVFTNSEVYPRVTASNLNALLPPVSTVRITAALSISTSGYYSSVTWRNGLQPPFGSSSGEVVPLQIKTGSATHELSTGASFIGYPYTTVGGPTPDQTIGDFSVEFLP